NVDALTSVFQPRRLMIASAAGGGKHVSVEARVHQREASHPHTLQQTTALTNRNHDGAVLAFQTYGEFADIMFMLLIDITQHTSLQEWYRARFRVHLDDDASMPRCCIPVAVGTVGETRRQYLN